MTHLLLKVRPYGHTIYKKHARSYDKSSMSHVPGCCKEQKAKIFTCLLRRTVLFVLVCHSALVVTPAGENPS